MSKRLALAVVFAGWTLAAYTLGVSVGTNRLDLKHKEEQIDNLVDINKGQSDSIKDHLNLGDKLNEINNIYINDISNSLGVLNYQGGGVVYNIPPAANISPSTGKAEWRISETDRKELVTVGASCDRVVRQLRLCQDTLITIEDAYRSAFDKTSNNNGNPKRDK